MASGRRSVTAIQRQDSERLPDALTEGALLIQGLSDTGMLDEVGERLKVRREGGYHGLDVVLFFILMLTARFSSVKEFGDFTRPHRRQLGALASRRTLPSPSSVSRFLSAVREDTVDEFMPWLFLEGSGALEVLKHPAVLMRDGMGQGWHVFDLDPTVSAVRRREGTHGEEYPEEQPRSHEFEPGYPGRKRGDLQISRMSLQHAGSSAWLGIWTQPGNGRWRDASSKALATVVRTCEALGHDTRRALVRADGAAGNTPFILACNDAQVSFVVRAGRTDLLDDPDIRAYMTKADWYAVEDGCSGPKRHATDLGWHTLAGDSRDADGQPLPPARARVVVSRFPVTEGGTQGAGRTEGAWHYELFYTDVSPDALPAPELVTTYYQRVAIENRFLQEDKKLGLDHIFSYHVPGQNLANLVGLLVWNLRTSLGFASAAPLPPVPPQEPRKAQVVTTPAPASLPDTPAEGAPQAPAAVSGVAMVGKLPWAKMLTPHTGWKWSCEQQTLLCPANQAAKLVSAKSRSASGRGASLRFQVAAANCRSCAMRAACIASDDPKLRKEKVFNVKGAEGRAIAEHPDMQPRRTPAKPPAPKAPEPPPWTPPTDAPCLATLTLMFALLLPAVLRGLFAAACQAAEIHVKVTDPPPVDPRPSVYAYTAAQRQHRRLTWKQLRDINAAPPERDTKIQVIAASDGAAQRLLELSRTIRPSICQR
jgi:hypothetical protein